MALPVNVDSSGINLVEDFVGREDELATLQTNLVDKATWRGAIVYGPEGSGKTNLALKFAEQTAESFEVIKLIPLKETSTAQTALDWLGGCLQNYEKQLKSKQVSNFIQSKDEADNLEDKIAPLVKLLTLRKVLVIFDDYIADEATEIPQLLSSLVDNVNKSSCFIITHTSDVTLNVANKVSKTIGHIDMTTTPVEVEETENEVNMAEENAVETPQEEAEQPQETESVEETEAVEEPTPTEEPTESVEETTPEEPAPEESEPEPEVEPEPEPEVEAEPEPEPIPQGDQTAAQLLATGQQLLSENDHAGAKQAYEQAISMFKSANDKAGLANSVEALGVLCITQTNYGEAQTHLEHALSLKQGLNDQSGILELLSQLVLISQLQGDTAQAQAYSQQSKELLQQETT